MTIAGAEHAAWWTAVHLDRAARDVGLVAEGSIDARGKWHVDLCSPAGERLRKIEGATRPAMVAVCVALEAVAAARNAVAGGPAPDRRGAAS